MMRSTIGTWIGATALMVASTGPASATLVASGAFSGHAYEVHLDSQTWNASNADATSMGGYLSTITSAGESGFIGGLMAPFTGGSGFANKEFWIGGFRTGSGNNFTWVNGEGSVGNPRIGADGYGWRDIGPEPSNNPGEDYMTINVAGTGMNWNDQFDTNVASMAGYVLEKALPSPSASATITSLTVVNEGSTNNWTTTATAGSGQHFNGTSYNWSAPGDPVGVKSGSDTAHAAINSDTQSFTYADDGAYTISVSGSGPVHQDGTEFALGTAGFSDTHNVTVLNVDPSATLSLSSTTINEGQSITVSMTATDPGADAISFVIDGQGAGTDFATSGTRSSSVVNLGPFYENNGGSVSYNLSGTATDDDGGPGTDIASLTVLNLPPSITSITAPAEVRGNESFAFSAAATDPGLDTLVFEWDFDNDGLFDDFLGDTGNFAFNSSTGFRLVTLRVSDGDGGEAFQSISILVSEPSVLLLVGMGLLAMSGGSRRRRCGPMAAT